MSWKVIIVLLLIGIGFYAAADSWNKSRLQLCIRPHFDKNRDAICVSDLIQLPKAFFSSDSSVAPTEKKEDKGYVYLSSSKGNNGKNDLGTVYRYRLKEGREQYTNSWNAVPTPHRKKAKAVDLSNVTLNEQTGNDINKRTSEQYEKLAEIDPCIGEAVKSTDNFATDIWSNYRPVVIIAAFILLLILATPFAIRRIDAPQWTRVLSMAIPTLAVIGLITFGLIRAGVMAQDIKGTNPRCNRGVSATLSERSNPISAHTTLLKDMQNKLDTIEQERRDRIETETKSK
jgi:hypothetical protein